MRAVQGHPWRVPCQMAAEIGIGTNPHPSARRAYVLRSRVRCKICQRRMAGITKTHPERGPKGDYAYYICTHDRANPRHVANAPDPLAPSPPAKTSS